MCLNSISVNSQILYAGLKWDGIKKADCTQKKRKKKKNGLNNVTRAGEAEVVVEGCPHPPTPPTPSHPLTHVWTPAADGMIKAACRAPVGIQVSLPGFLFAMIFKLWRTLTSPPPLVSRSRETLQLSGCHKGERGGGGGAMWGFYRPLWRSDADTSLSILSCSASSQCLPTVPQHVFPCPTRLWVGFRPIILDCFPQFDWFHP